MIIKRYFLHILVIIQTFQLNSLKAQDKPIRIAVAGMTHGHVGWILNRKELGDIELVGLAEPNEVLAKRLAIAYWLKKGRSYNNIKNNLKVSSATIASVQSKTDNPGFQMALKNLEAEEWANVWEKKIKKFIK